VCAKTDRKKTLHKFCAFLQENMTKLLCGDGGFCQSIEIVFKYGFKSNKFFSKKLFIWDYIGKNILTIKLERC